MCNRAFLWRAIIDLRNKWLFNIVTIIVITLVTVFYKITATSVMFIMGTIYFTANINITFERSLKDNIEVLLLLPHSLLGLINLLVTNVLIKLLIVISPSLIISLFINNMFFINFMNIFVYLFICYNIGCIFGLIIWLWYRKSRYLINLITIIFMLILTMIMQYEYSFIVLALIWPITKIIVNILMKKSKYEKVILNGG